MKQLVKFAALATTLALCISTARAQGNFAIQDGDRVVFYGDSITDSRQYGIFTETYILTRFPRLNVKFTQSGWSGDTVNGGGGGGIDLRLKRDVLAYKPTVVTIMLGMNDGAYRAFDQNIFNTYATGYQKIITTLKQGAPGVRITAIKPSPYDDVTRKPNFEGGYNGVLVRYGQFIQELGAKENLTVSDFNSPMVAMLTKANAANPELAAKILPDRVHPSPGGYLVMAEALLKSWNAPAIVTAVTVDAAAGKIVRSENTAVSGLKAGGGSLSWTQTDGALPFVITNIDPVVSLAINSSDVTEALNQEPLKVTGLKPGKYTLNIDGAAVGVFSAEELTSGVNLATLDTPMAKQAALVYGLTWQRTGIHMDRWRNVLVPLEKDNSPAAAQAAQAKVSILNEQEAQITQRQHDAARPVPHTYSIVPN